MHGHEPGLAQARAGSAATDGRPRVLVVDPSSQARAALATSLSEAGCEVVAVRTGIAAAYACRTERPSVVVMELDLGPAGTWSGLLLIPILVKEGAHVLVVTRPELAHLAGRVVTAGALRMLPKSDLAGLATAVHEEHAAHVQAGYPPGGADGAGDDALDDVAPHERVGEQDAATGGGVSGGARSPGRGCRSSGRCSAAARIRPSS